MENPTSGDALARASALVLEDEFVIAMDLEDMLADWGCGQVSVASSADAARARMAEGPVDLVIADYNLADGDSSEVVEALARAGARVIVLTGQTIPGETLARMGDPPVLVKPVQPSLLRRVVEEALG